ncbi:MAG: c-type cytochrome biogenesis protein CcmI [Cytophagales bacterium]|nr:c-type cytochrome biogenesis protein CcmI [Rhizobacter sp.]
MTGFLLAAAVLVAVTLLLLLRPWRRAPKAGATSTNTNTSDVNTGVYRDQLQELDRDLAAGTLSADDHAQARAELQRRLLDDASKADASAAAPFGMRRTALLLMIAMPLAAAGLYAKLGTPGALNPLATAVPTQENVEKMVTDLAARMEKNPGDTKGWVVLARAYRAMGRLPQAEDAFNRMGEVLYQDATLLAEYGDVLATRAMGNFDGKPAEIVARALKLDPQNPMALSLAATAAYNRNDFTQAVAYWEQLIKLVPPDSEDARWLTQAVDKTRSQMAGPGTANQPVAAATDKKTPAAVATGNAAVTGRVSLAPALAAKVQPTDTVFVFARNPQGSRMPLAVQRAKVADLPLDFKLDDSMAMSPEFKLSSAAEVRIEARISKTGSATPGPGDLIGVGPVVKPGSSKVAVQIDQVRP